MKEFTRHPLSARYRDLTADEYQTLKDSLTQDGQQQDIVHIGDEILDGWHRYKACRDLDIEPRIKGYTGADPEGYVTRMNDARRHESKADRDARILRMRSEGKSTRQIAEEVGCSDGTVRNVIDSGAQNYAPDKPNTIKGRDGKTYSAKPRTSKPKAKPKTEEVSSEPTAGEIPEEDKDMANRAPESIAIDERIKELVNAGNSRETIAKDVGLSVISVRNRIDRMRMNELAEKAKSIDELAAIARGELSLTAQQKLDVAVKLAVDAEFIKMRKEATRQVEEAIKAEMEPIEKMKAEAYKTLEEAKAARDSAIEARKSIDQHMTYEEFKIIRGCLHPDKQPDELREKYNRALQIFMRLEKSVNPHLPIAELRNRGWEHVSPFARKQRTAH